jgi:hypothetical protein
MLRRPLESALAALIGIENLGSRVFGKRLLDRLKAEIDLHGNRQPPSQNTPRGPVHNRR